MKNLINEQIFLKPVNMRFFVVLRIVKYYFLWYNKTIESFLILNRTA